MNEVLFNDFYELGRLDFYLFFFSFFFPMEITDRTRD